MVTEKTPTSGNKQPYCELNGGESDHPSINFKDYIEKNYKKLGMNDVDKIIVMDILSNLFGENGYIDQKKILSDYFNPTV